MRLLQRLLRGPHERRDRHLQSCAECRLQQRRERQYLERLRGAEIPTASDDLTARLLARTEELARREQPDPSPPAARRFHPALRAAVLVTGGTAAAAVLLGGSAYLMGADTAPQADGAPAPVFLQRDLSMSAAAVEEGAGTPAAWSLTGGPDFTPEGALTAAQLSTLRSQGWTCPELRELGYHLVWARAGMLAGGDILELLLTDGRDFATILEQHADLPRQSGSESAGPQAAPAAPVNVLTGHPATSDGFTEATAPERGPAAGGASGAGRGSLWINHSSPVTAIYQTGDATFTYVSDQPADHAADGVAALVRSRAAAPGAAGDGEAPTPGTVGGPGADAGAGAGSGAGPNFTVRLERGLGRIVELLTP